VLSENGRADGVFSPLSLGAFSPINSGGGHANDFDLGLDDSNRSRDQNLFTYH